MCVGRGGGKEGGGVTGKNWDEGGSALEGLALQERAPGWQLAVAAIAGSHCTVSVCTLHSNCETVLKKQTITEQPDKSCHEVCSRNRRAWWRRFQLCSDVGSLPRGGTL